MSDIYVVVHFSTTCDENGMYVSKDSSEVVEVAWIMIDSTSLTQLHQQSVLVRPAATPITPLFTSLTNLSWEHVRNAGSFADAMIQLDQSIQDVILQQGRPVTFVSLNSWDLRVQVQREARDKGLVLPPYIQHPRIFDLRTEYTKWQQYHPEMQHCSASSISGICTALDVPGPVGNLYQPPQQLRPRRAMEEAVLSANIVKALIFKSQPFDTHPDVMVQPMDCQADVLAFLRENSTVLHLANLPQNITQSELESWFTLHGGRPVAFWTFQTPANAQPSDTGFAVFQTHKEALELLMMNGRVLNERVIEVTPSGNAVIERAKPILTQFPASKKTDPDQVIGYALLVGLATFNAVPLAFDARLPLIMTIPKSLKGMAGVVMAAALYHSELETGSVVTTGATTTTLPKTRIVCGAEYHVPQPPLLTLTHAAHAAAYTTTTTQNRYANASAIYGANRRDSNQYHPNHPNATVFHMDL